MACNEQLVVRIRDALKNISGVGERRMFGGVCFTINGNMTCGVAKDDLMVRIGPDNYDSALKLPYGRPMDFTGRPMKGYVFVASPGIANESSLKDWVGAGVAYARTLPAKSPKKRRRKKE